MSKQYLILKYKYPGLSDQITFWKTNLVHGVYIWGAHREETSLMSFYTSQSNTLHRR